MLQGRRLPPEGPARRFSCTNGSQGLVSDAIQTVGGVPPGRRSWHSSWPPALSAGFRSGIVAATGHSPHRRLSARPKGGPRRGRRHGRSRLGSGFLPLAIGVDSEVLDIPAEGSCDEPLQCRVEEPNRRARTSWRCVHPRWRVMDVRFLGFGSIEVEGRAYEHDIVISRGAVRKRSKKPSKPYRGKFRHTPLSTDEELPWGGPQLIIGTGAHGSLPIMPEVVAEAARRNIDLVAVPTEQACRLIAGLKRREVRAVLHVTC